MTAQSDLKRLAGTHVKERMLMETHRQLTLSWKMVNPNAAAGFLLPGQEI